MSRYSMGAAFILTAISACALFATPALAQLPDCGLDKNGANTAQVDYVEVYSSKYAKWCVDVSVWPANSAHISQFFAYYDVVVAELTSLFNVSIPLPILMEVTSPTDVFCACGPKFGERTSVRIGANMFSSGFTNPQTKQTVLGFWGYLAPLHETINTLTGQVGGGGWPADWWADHRSPFPNVMDEYVMRDIGEKTHNQTLIDAAAAQHERFSDPTRTNPKQEHYDPEVGMFDAFFDNFGGFDAFAGFFRLVEGDNIRWQTVSKDPTLSPDNNHSELLSEYVIAYLSLAFGTTSDLTPTFAAAGVGKLDTTIPPYTLDSAVVKAIADAHCSIHAAGVAGDSQLKQLQAGNYQSAMASGGTSQSCPSECSWTQNKCVAKW
jgi:hypothetical protein